MKNSGKVLPYHFVPATSGPRPDDLPTETFRTQPPQHLGQHVYAPGTRSGRLICRLTTVSPLVVGAQRQTADPDGPDPKAPSEVEPLLIDGRPAIPGSTLRGLISSTAEAISNSSLRVLERRIYSFRSQADKQGILRNLGEIIVKEGKEGPEYFLRNIPQIFKFKSHSSTRGLKSWCRDKPTYYGIRRPSSLKPLDVLRTPSQGTLLQREKVNQPALWSGLDANQRQNYVRGVIRVMQDPDGQRDLVDTRKWEFFIPYDPIEAKWVEFPIPSPVVERFHQLADERTAAQREDAGHPLPYEPIGTRRNLDPKSPEDRRFRLKTGDLVYYRAQGDRIEQIALSAIWRQRVEDPKTQEPYDSWDFFRAIDPELLPFHDDRQQITVAEQLFGFVSEGRAETSEATQRRTGTLALKSRVRIADASLGDEYSPQGVLLPRTTLEILASPKPPSPSLYFNDKSSSRAVTKQALNPQRHAPQGRKGYVHQRYDSSTPADRAPWSTSEGDHLNTRVTPVDAEVSFDFHIDFDNLTERELGLLLCALEPSDDFGHKLGMGKSLGLGSVRLEVVALCEVDRPARYRAAGLFAPRYTRMYRQADGPAWASRYDREQTAEAPQDTLESLNQLRAVWREHIPTALRRLGESTFDPEEVGWPEVFSPSPDEEKSFDWFVSNDAQDLHRKESLAPLSGGDWPRLKKLPKKQGK